MQKYSEKKILKTYQCDRHGVIRPVMLMNELQAIADTHAEILGAGRTFCLSNNIAWVVTHYLIDIAELPRDGEELEFVTWPSRHDSLKAVRDFEIRGSDGRVMVRATSQWVMIDLDRRMPVRLSDRLPQGWTVIEERALDLPFEKFPDFETGSCTEFQTRYDDVDVNQHVNNAVYASWATESVGFDFRDSHLLRKIFINFKKEISSGVPEIIVESKLEGAISRHMIKSGETEHANIVCEWAPASPAIL
ncbi:MAG: thioesterase [Alphaproteobacteria bacterium]|nr:thioesterase [Alphaproteobacteria bacterium]